MHYELINLQDGRVKVIIKIALINKYFDMLNAEIQEATQVCDAIDYKERDKFAAFNMDASGTYREYRFIIYSECAEILIAELTKIINEEKDGGD